MEPLASSYDRVAGEYAAEFENEMQRKPFDRKMLDWLVEKTEGSAPICDLGCGPGQVARYLHTRGATTCGIDLSSGMVKRAQQLNPSIPSNKATCCISPVLRTTPFARSPRSTPSFIFHRPTS